MREDSVYRRLFEGANAPILIINPDFNIIECNEMVCKLLEMPRSELVGKTPVDISPAFQKNGVPSTELGKQYFSSVMEGKDLRFEWTHLKKDGSELIVEVSLFGFTMDGKQNFFAVWRDMTEVKQKEDELIESEKRFRVIFTEASDGMILHRTDKEAKITDCNEAAFQKLGYLSREELIGKSILDISPEYQADGLKSKHVAIKHLKLCLQNGRTELEWIHLKKDKTPIWFDIVLTKITFLGEDYIHTVWRDITIKKKQQEELENYRNKLESLVEKRTSDLKSAQAQLIQAEKMASLGILTSGVAHEINNPLNFIRGSYGVLDNLIRNKHEENTDVGKLLDAIEIGIDRISNIVDGLNQFSKPQKQHDEDCDIHQIIDNCLLILNNQFKDETQLIKNYHPQELLCTGNIGKLHQVFLNILSNAVDAIEAKDVISISSKIEKDQILIEFTDTGIGIKPSDLKKIFDPFFTTKPPGKGTGLGLSVSYKIIEEHGGQLSITSKFNHGTQVLVILPKATPGGK